MKRGLVLIVMSALASWPPVARDGGVAMADTGGASARVKKRLLRGLSEFRDLEYRRCIRTLAPIPRDPAATRSQRLRALEVIGQSHIILGDEARATEAFQDLLAIDPGYQLRDDSGSPKIRVFFDDVKRDYVPGFDADAVAELEHDAPRRAVAGRRVEIEVRVGAGASKVKTLLLYTRRRGLLAYEAPRPLRHLAGGRWRARFKPAASSRAYVLEYYLEARGLADTAIARIGGPENPLGLAVGAGAQLTPWWRRWYTIAGAAALVGGIGTALIVTSGDSVSDGTLQPGRVTLSP